MRQAAWPPAMQYLLCSKDHLCAWYRQAVDDQRADIHPGHAKTMVENHLVKPFLKVYGNPFDKPAIDAGDLEEGPIGKNVGIGSDGDHRGFVERIGPVWHQLDPPIAGRVAGDRTSGVRCKIE